MIRKVVIGTIAAVVVLAAAIAVYLYLPAPAEPERAPLSAVRADMLDWIATEGARQAYVHLKEEYRDRPFDDQHNAAHIFGESLYESEGIEGIAACDTDLNFGCYHGFLRAAIAQGGTDIISALDGVCATSGIPATCQHGIGHGILEYEGHSNLLKALQACKLTNQPDPLAGCTGGVFMEYNVPLTVMENGVFSIDARPLTDQGPYEPCPNLPSEFQASCYHELPQWWGQVYGDTKTAGELCAGIGSTDYQMACFHGLAGTIPSQADYVAESAIGLCKLMPSPETESRCFVNAAWAFISNANDTQAAGLLCKEALPEHRIHCPQ